MFKKVFLISLFLLVAAGLFFWGFLSLGGESGFLSPLGSSLPDPEPKPLATYSFPSLSERQFEGSEIEIEGVIKEESDSRAYFFFYQSEGKHASSRSQLKNQLRKNA